MRHTFNGVVYRVDLEPFLAACDQPDRSDCPEIHFPNGIRNTKTSLILVVHESIHASNWGLPEETVHRMGQEIGSLLWKLGYRLKETE
jgi:hypothetical protein